MKPEHPILVKATDTPLWKTQKPAKGVKGMILLMPDIDGKYHPVFRVSKHTTSYRRKEFAKKEAGKPFDEHAWDYTDYVICHYDFDVTITEDHAMLYEMKSGKKILDYPERQICFRPSKKDPKKLVRCKSLH